MSSAITFHLYRYQLLPIDRHGQGDLLDTRSTQDILKVKNQIFAEAVSRLQQMTGRRTDAIVKVENAGKDEFILQIAPNRSLQLETEDFKTELLPNWPRVLAIIFNRDDEQIVAIQHRTSAFAGTDIAVNLLRAATKRHLESNHLRAIFAPIFNEHYFWELVAAHENQIKEIHFELVTPNMANISNVLPDELKDFAKNVNAVRTDLRLKADDASALDIDKSDTALQGLVEYASEGGGDIALRIKGFRKKVHTSTSRKDIVIGELELSTAPDVLVQILRDLMK